MTSLYELGKEYELIFAEIENNDGEMTADQEQRLAELDSDIVTKTDNYIGYIRELEADAKKLKELKARYASLQATRENTVTRLKQRMLEYMQGRNIDIVTGEIGKVRMQFSESLKADIETLSPDWVELVYRAKTTDIKAALKSGQEIIGAELVKNPYVRIY